MKANFLIFVFALTAFTNCTSEKSQQEDLYNELMAVHDEVMPRMEEVSSLSQRLKTKGSLLQKDSIGNQKKSDEIEKTLDNLHKASNKMLEWMHHFNSSYDTLPHLHAINYLKEEKLKIEQVKKEMNTAIDEAKEKL